MKPFLLDRPRLIINSKYSMSRIVCIMKQVPRSWVIHWRKERLLRRLQKTEICSNPGLLQLDNHQFTVQSYMPVSFHPQVLIKHVHTSQEIVGVVIQVHLMGTQQRAAFLWQLPGRGMLSLWEVRLVFSLLSFHFKKAFNSRLLYAGFFLAQFVFKV